MLKTSQRATWPLNFCRQESYGKFLETALRDVPWFHWVLQSEVWYDCPSPSFCLSVAPAFCSWWIHWTGTIKWGIPVQQTWRTWQCHTGSRGTRLSVGQRTSNPKSTESGSVCSLCPPTSSWQSPPPWPPSWPGCSWLKPVTNSLYSFILLNSTSKPLLIFRLSTKVPFSNK